MTEQHQQSASDQKSPKNSGKPRIDLSEFKDLRDVFGQEGNSGNRKEGLDGEIPTQLFYGKDIEGNVDHKEHRAKGEIGGVLCQKSRAGRSADQEIHVGENSDPKCSKQRADDYSLYVIEYAMLL